MKTPRFTVLGAGNGGLATAGVLALSGHDVTLFESKDFEKNLEPIRESGVITLLGEISGRAPIHNTTTDIGEAIDSADVVIIVTPSSAHRPLATLCVPFLKSGQIVVLHPGRPGGALEFINSAEIPEGVIVAETQSLLYAVRKLSQYVSVPASKLESLLGNQVWLYAVKKKVSIASIPSTETQKVVDLVKEVFPQLVPAESVLETSLNDVGSVFHPAPALLNLARIDSGERFLHYHEGISKSVARIVEAIDKERLSVCASLDVKGISAKKWLAETYDVEGEDLFEALQNHDAYIYAHSPQQDIMHHYYLIEVPMELVPISSLGQLTGTPTPCIDAVITLVSELHQKNHRQEGRNAARMGLEGLTKEQIIAKAKGG
jgi:opine dehydrogenase